MNLANRITIARILLIPCLVLLLQPYPQWLGDAAPLFAHLNQYGVYYAAALFLLTAATDKLDGYVARKYKMVTNLGKLLDPLADKLLISAALLMLAYLHMTPAWMVMVILGREVVVTAIRTVASASGIALAADRLGKLKMVAQVAAITAALLNNYPFALVTDIPVDLILMMIAVLLTIYSGLNYLLQNYRRLLPNP
ncbi:CDP-diacylglycerol--glycerol-3-phosphate 3-phosphatidyltransferase [Cohnella lubricantis]|uniref:CDP-diacylglycerol--glycerol-3-phosphate 3-phosphatidyltransferase n=1 Tax=Cohnella lubricantis TaxID=2163172 RepID=A0A841TDJ2_9BACL|nr:CDP-diacylglycerol--glycerol-3-phosphate 3-phosphatidyltransferase [Cohnella lubricantis]MBB6677047.1 CDP-diacylglycerol--glycerol-3-phosphate 3-phosphatidyltransferase [Cohnella lubricantis]MBP2119283.1 CDP-diacylglycerol--glycerol-3-phosphate 3-phosphatidyltransferase [Cohnella lubricantis]